MADVSTAAVVGGGLTAGIIGLIAGVNPEAAIGALFGALVYMTTTWELPIWQRTLFFVTSFFMGYLIAPSITGVEMWGVQPFAFPGPAAFLASLMVVTISLAALKAKTIATSAGEEP